MPAAGTRVPQDPVAEAERLFAATCELTGPRLSDLAAQRRLRWVNERDHLQPEFTRALREIAEGARPQPSVAADLNHRLKDSWPGLGRFDAGLNWPGGATVYAELKAGSGTGVALMACAWDALKAAFCLRHGVGQAMFLIAAAPAELWRGPSLGLEMFADAEWDSADIRRRYEKGFRRWERDGYKPITVPARFKTVSGARYRFLVGTDTWIIGIARVVPADDAWLQWIPLLPPTQD